MPFAARGPAAQNITSGHSLEFGLGENSPLYHIYELAGWVLLMGAEEMQSDGTVYFRLPIIPAIGPKPGFVAAYDDRTLIVTTGDDISKEILGKDFKQIGTRWNDAWKSLDTGLASIISSNHEIDSSHGSWQLVQTLLANELVDEIRLWTFPVVVGSGKRLFGDGILPSTLTLANTEACPSGAVMTIYRRV